jgi:hypothetical protein
MGRITASLAAFLMWAVSFFCWGNRCDFEILNESGKIFNLNVMGKLDKRRK